MDKSEAVSEAVPQEPADAHLEAFIQLVDRCAAAREKHLIVNDNALRARYLITKLIETAGSDVCLCTGNLLQVTPPDDAHPGTQIYAWSTLIESVRGFLRKPGTTLRILAQEPIDDGEDNALLKALKGDAQVRGHLSVRTMTDPKPAAPHFLVADGCAYRMEINGSNFRANADFNDKKTATNLKELFDRLEKSSTDVFPRTLVPAI